MAEARTVLNSLTRDRGNGKRVVRLSAVNLESLANDEIDTSESDEDWATSAHGRARIAADKAEASSSFGSEESDSDSDSGSEEEEEEEDEEEAEEGEGTGVEHDGGEADVKPGRAALLRAHRTALGVCCICLVKESTLGEDDIVQQCRGCGVEVHIGCYGNDIVPSAAGAAGEAGKVGEEEDEEEEEEDEGKEEEREGAHEEEDKGKAPAGKGGKGRKQNGASSAAAHGKVKVKKEEGGEASEEEEDEAVEEPPWWCEACRAGVIAPACCFCPNEGGAFKATATDGWWIHAICALYGKGVSWADPATMSPVYVHHVAPERWSAKACHICANADIANTGVCMGCDAGMCRVSFHVTCAQRQGLLTESAGDDNTLDPYYAYCSEHTDKIKSKMLKKVWQKIEANSRLSPAKPSLSKEEQESLRRAKQRFVHVQESWRKENQEALPVIHAHNIKVNEQIEKQAKASSLNRTSWGVTPELSVAFVEYFESHGARLDQLCRTTEAQEAKVAQLQEVARGLRSQVVAKIATVRDASAKREEMIQQSQALSAAIVSLGGRKVGPLKGSEPLTLGVDECARVVEQMLPTCHTCKSQESSETMAVCDVCNHHYHIHCLTPPLKRLPKKSKYKQWMCSECDHNAVAEKLDESAMLSNAEGKGKRKVKPPAHFTPSKRRPKGEAGGEEDEDEEGAGEGEEVEDDEDEYKAEEVEDEEDEDYRTSSDEDRPRRKRGKRGPQKKGRGRGTATPTARAKAKPVAAPVPVSAVLATPTDPNAPPVKRGRGRPRKHPLPATASAAAAPLAFTTTTMPPASKNGSPAKTTTTTTKSITTTTTMSAGMTDAPPPAPLQQQQQMQQQVQQQVQAAQGTTRLRLEIKGAASALYMPDGVYEQVGGASSAVPVFVRVTPSEAIQYQLVYGIPMTGVNGWMLAAVNPSTGESMIVLFSYSPPIHPSMVTPWFVLQPTGFVQSNSVTVTPLPDL